MKDKTTANKDNFIGSEISIKNSIGLLIYNCRINRINDEFLPH